MANCTIVIKEEKQDDETSSSRSDPKSVELIGELPADGRCSFDSEGLLYYVASDQNFVVCLQGLFQEIDLASGEINPTDSYVTEEVPAGDQCEYGGLKTISFRDENENGIFDEGEKSVETINCLLRAPDIADADRQRFEEEVRGQSEAASPEINVILTGSIYSRTINSAPVNAPEGTNFFVHTVKFLSDGRVHDNSNSFFGNPPTTSAYRLEGNKLILDSSTYYTFLDNYSKLGTSAGAILVLTSSGDQAVEDPQQETEAAPEQQDAVPLQKIDD